MNIIIFGQKDKFTQISTKLPSDGTGHVWGPLRNIRTFTKLSITDTFLIFVVVLFRSSDDHCFPRLFLFSDGSRRQLHLHDRLSIDSPLSNVCRRANCTLSCIVLGCNVKYCSFCLQIVSESLYKTLSPMLLLIGLFGKQHFIKW